MKVLITGVSGTGKSTVAKILNERGVAAVDLHDVPSLFYWQDKKTGARVEYTPDHPEGWFDTVDRRCDFGKLEEILNRSDDVIVAGSDDGSDKKEFFALFDKVLLLQASPEVLVRRMETRTNKSGYGKTKEEQDDNIAWQKKFDPALLAQGAIPINTDRPIDKVVKDILKQAT